MKHCAIQNRYHCGHRECPDLTTPQREPEIVADVALKDWICPCGSTVHAGEPLFGRATKPGGGAYAFMCGSCMRAEMDARWVRWQEKERVA